MSLVPWRNKEQQDESDAPITQTLSQVRREMDRLFDQFLRNPWSGAMEMWRSGQDWVPSLDMTEDDDKFVVRMEVPGVDAKDIDVRVTGNLLTVSGEKAQSEERTREGLFHRERRFGSFRRSVRLPVDIDPEKVSAEHANGVLTVKLAKTDSATSKQIPIKGSELD